MLPALAKYFHVTVDHLLNIGGNSSMKPMESTTLLLQEWSSSDASALLAMKQNSKNFMYYLQLETVNDSLACIETWKNTGRCTLSR